MADIPKPHRPSYQEPASLEALAERSDPIARLHAAHDTAAALVHVGKADPALVARVVAVADEVGIATLADLWESRPAQSLPGALYRLYVLREWMTHSPEQVAAQYQAGIDDGAEQLSEPEQVRAIADEILHGAFTGDVALAFARAASVCATTAAGRLTLGHAPDDASKLAQMGADLAACAAAWQAGTLD